MALAKKDIETITEIVDSRIKKIVKPASKRSFDTEIIERIVTVEEELKHQRELMLKGFEQVDKRFEQVDKRFEQVDKRFEQIDKRFESFEKRFESLESRMFTFMVWSFGALITCSGVIIAVLKLT